MCLPLRFPAPKRFLFSLSLFFLFWYIIKITKSITTIIILVPGIMINNTKGKKQAIQPREAKRIQTHQSHRDVRPKETPRRAREGPRAAASAHAAASNALTRCPGVGAEARQRPPRMKRRSSRRALGFREQQGFLRQAASYLHISSTAALFPSVNA